MAEQIKKSEVKKIEPVKKITAGEAYDIKRKAKESKSYGGVGRAAGSSAADKKAKSKERLAKMQSMIAELRSRRERRSQMASKLNPFKK
jgi:hypothetical protein